MYYKMCHVIKKYIFYFIKNIFILAHHNLHFHFLTFSLETVSLDKTLKFTLV